MWENTAEEKEPLQVMNGYKRLATVKRDVAEAHIS